MVTLFGWCGDDALCSAMFCCGDVAEAEALKSKFAAIASLSPASFPPMLVVSVCAVSLERRAEKSMTSQTARKLQISD